MVSESLTPAQLKKVNLAYNQWKDLNSEIKRLEKIKEEEQFKIVEAMERCNLRTIVIDDNIKITLVQAYTKKLNKEAALNELSDKGIIDLYQTLDEKKIMTDFPHLVEETPKKASIRITRKED